MSRPPRRPGRPPLDASGPSADVHLRLSSDEYDAVFQDAARARVSVQEVIRRRLRRTRDDGSGDDE